MIRISICIAPILIPVLITGACIDEEETGQNMRQEDEIMLPEPRTTGEISIEDATQLWKPKKQPQPPDYIPNPKIPKTKSNQKPLSADPSKHTQFRVYSTL